MNAGGWLADFRSRYDVSAEMTRMLLAGVVALAVLIAAVIALPRSTKTVSATAGGGSVSNYGPQNESSGGLSVPGKLPGVPGVVVGGPQSNSEVPGAAGSNYAGGNPAHVSSRFIPSRAPGITKTTIYIGVGYSSQSAAADRALGAGSAAPSYDTRDVFNTAVDYGNKHGGFAGRRLKPLYYDYNVTDDRNTLDQAACAYYTQDNKSFFIIAGSDIRDACAEKAHGVGLGSGAATSATFAKYPHLIDTSSIRFDRLGQVTVSGLYKAGYFAGKLGLVTWDDPDYKTTISRGYLPELAKHNIKVSQIAYVPVPQNFAAIGDMTAAVRSAVAKFKALGIDHVIIQDGPAGVFVGEGITLEFMQNAKSQDYYPRYGENAYNIPGDSLLPSDEQDHLLAITDEDLDRSEDAGWHTNAARDKCYKIMADAGYPVKSSNLNDEAIAAGSCDTVFFLQRVFARIPTIDADSFINGALTLGTSFQSGLVYGTKLFPGRRDGGDMVRTEEYFDSCKCLKYKSAPAYAD